MYKINFLLQISVQFLVMLLVDYIVWNILVNSFAEVSFPATVPKFQRTTDPYAMDFRVNGKSEMLDLVMERTKALHDYDITAKSDSFRFQAITFLGLNQVYIGRLRERGILSLPSFLLL